MFDAPGKRKINLGGATPSNSSKSNILDQARTLRQTREKEKERVERAIRVQSWWRGVKEGRDVRKNLVRTIEKAETDDLGGLQVLRSLVMVGRRTLGAQKVNGNAVSLTDTGNDLRRILETWSSRVVEGGIEAVLFKIPREPGSAEETASWLFIVRQISAMLLWFGTKFEGASSLNQLNILLSILQAPSVRPQIAPYLLKHAYYTHLGHGIQSIPESQRSKHPALSILVQLSTLVLSPLSSSSNPEQYSYALTQLLGTIFTVPLLPNILPPASLMHLSSQVPFSDLHLADVARLMREITLNQKMHLLATMMVFVTANRLELIRKQGDDAVRGYLTLMTALVDGLPLTVLRSPTASKTATSVIFYTEVDEDEPHVDKMDVDSDEVPIPDSKTSKRIQILNSTAYIHSLLPISSSPSLTTYLIPFLLSLCLAFPSSVPQIILTSSQGQALIRQIYSNFVRQSNLGKEGTSIRTISGKDGIQEWPALLLLVELYGTNLMTMGDDEFFGTSLSSGAQTTPHASSVSQPKNPLSLDELTAFGRQLLNTVWVIWWQIGDLIRDSKGIELGTGYEGIRRVGWESVRGRLTGCLVGIHTRHSRKPFAPKDHWLVTSTQIGDIQGFVDAAIYEAQEDPETLQSLRNILPPSQFSRFRATKDHSSRLSQYLTPRLGILNNIPFAIPFDLRVSIFRQFILADRKSRASSLSSRPRHQPAQISHRSEPDPPARPTRISRRSEPNPPARPASSRGILPPNFQAASINLGGQTVQFLFDSNSADNQRFLGHLASGVSSAERDPDGDVDDEEMLEGDSQEENGQSMSTSSESQETPAEDVEDTPPRDDVLVAEDGGWRSKERVLIRRTNVAQDGFDRLREKDLKEPIEIVFVDKWGQEEPGIDGGGLFKEFLTYLCKEVFDPNRGLWLANKNNELYPNPVSTATEPQNLEWYRFIGRILGKAMHDRILLDIPFAGFLLAKWLGRQSFLDDLASLDPDLYNGLVFLKHFNGDVKDLSLNFTVAVEGPGETKSVELIQNGSNIAVTRENRLQYIQLISHYRLVTQIKKQSEAFFEGLSDIIDTRWIRMFNQQEVQVLIGGVDAPVDLDDLRKHTVYGGLYNDDHPVILTFWNVVNEFDEDQRRALLRFVTSCPRPPLLGFKELKPNFSIRDAGTDELRLPTAGTCVNLLKLPHYSSADQLRVKLLQAINANSGFDLS